MEHLKQIFLLCILFGGSAWAQISTTQYYDNRKAAVVWTVDDLLGDRGPKFWAAAELARSNGVVISIGIVTGPSYMSSQLWAEMQAQMDRGCVEPMNHSWSHKVPMDTNNYTTNLVKEVEQSTADIKDKLNFSPASRYRGQEYLVAWAQPYGDLTEPWQTEMRTVLKNNNYLADRRATAYQSGFSTWSELDGMYGRIKTSDTAGTDHIYYFDRVYATNGIYHLFTHPWNSLGDVTAEGNVWTHAIRYIGNRKDCWYVGFDHLYMYHYLQSQVSLSMELLTNSNDELVYNVSVPAAEREKYGLSYPITYKVTVPTNWSTAKVLYSDADTPGGVVMAEKTTNDFFNGENVYRNDLANHAVYVSQAFPQQYDDFQIKVVNTTDMSSQDTDGDGFDDEFEILNGLDRFKDQSAIVSYIRSHQQRFGLYSAEDVGTLYLGDLVLEKSAQAQLNIGLQLEESQDLITWTNCGTKVNWPVVPSADKMFYRVKGFKND